MSAPAKPPAIALTGVKSSQVSHVGYDAGTKTLAVKFHSGGLYHYSGVPPEVHSNLLKAESAGKFLHAHVKGKFKHALQGEPKKKRAGKGGA